MILISLHLNSIIFESPLTFLTDRIEQINYSIFIFYCESYGINVLSVLIYIEFLTLKIIYSLKSTRELSLTHFYSCYQIPLGYPLRLLCIIIMNVNSCPTRTPFCELFLLCAGPGSRRL